MKKKLAFISSILILFFGLLYFVGYSSGVKRFAIHQAAKTVEKQLGLQLSVGQMRGNLFRHLVIDDLRLGEVITVERVEVSYNLLLLVRKEIGIRGLHISNPVVDIEKALAVKVPKQEGERFTFSIDSLILTNGTVVYGEREFNLSLRASMSNKRISLTDLSITLPNSEITLYGMVDLKDSLSLTHSFQLDLRDLAVGEGKISLNGKTRGTVENPVSSGDFSLLSERVGAVSFLYHYEDSVLTLRDIIITRGNLELRGDVSGNIIKRRGSLSLAGTVGKERVTIVGSMEGERMELRAKTGKGKLSLTGKIGEEIDVVIKGAYDGNPFNGSFRYSNSNLTGMLSSGRIAFAKGLTVHEVLVTFGFSVGKEKQGTALILVNGIRYQTNHVGNIRVAIDLTDEQLHLACAGLLEGRGSIALNPPGRYAFSLRLERFGLAPFVPDGTGIATIAAKVTGDVRKPADARGNIVLEDFEANIKDIPVSLDAPVHVSLSGMEAVVEQSAISVGGSRITFGGTVPLEKGSDLDFKTAVEDFDLAEMNAFIPERALRGRCRAEVSITGALTKPLLTGMIDIQDVFCAMEEDTVGPAQCRVVFDQDTIAVTKLVISLHETMVSIRDPIVLILKKDRVLMHRSALFVGDNAVFFEGQFPVSKQDSFNVALELKDFHLAILNGFVPQRIVDGIANANIRLSGKFTDPQIMGDLQMEQLSLAIESDTLDPIELAVHFDRDLIEITHLVVVAKKTRLANDGPIRIHYNKSQLIIDSSRIAIGERAIVFFGSFQPAEGSIDFSVKADSLDLSAFSPLISKIDLQGFITLAVTAKGSLSDPIITGNVAILSVYAFMARDTIGPVKGNVLFAEGTAQIPGLSIGYREGRILARGNVGINRKAQLTINIDNISIPLMKRSNVELEGDLNFAGTIDSAHLTGEIVVRGAYNEPIEAQVITRALNRINRPRKQLPGILNGIKMDIGINTEFSVQNSAAQLAVDGDMQIGGTALKPGVTGRTTVREDGRIGYLGRNFNIERGTVDFVNPNAIVPELDIQATREIVYQDTDYLVVLAVTGHPESLQVDVYSVPELPRPEVVALVITGKTRGVNTVSKSQGVGGKAVNYLVEGLKGRVEERIAETFGLEKVTLSGTITDPTLIRMGIEKRFIRRLKVSYSSGFENWRQQQVGMEYELNKHVSLYSLYDLENREAGAGIDFHVKRW